MSQEANASSFPSADGLSTFSFLGRVAGLFKNLPGHLVESAVKRISHKTANYTVTADECGTTFTNRGATSTITFTLPAATVGLHYIFVVRAASGTSWKTRIDPNGSETLETAAVPRVASAAGKYIEADTIGESIHLQCLEAGKWSIYRFEGTWTVEA